MFCSSCAALHVCSRSGGDVQSESALEKAKNTSFQVFRKNLQQSQADEKVLALRVEAFLLTSPVFVAFPRDFFK